MLGVIQDNLESPDVCSFPLTDFNHTEFCIFSNIHLIISMCRIKKEKKCQHLFLELIVNATKCLIY